MEVEEEEVKGRVEGPRAEQGCRVQLGTEAGAAVVKNNPHKTWTWPQAAPGHRLDSKDTTNHHSLSLHPSKSSHLS